jgi:MoaA/NifB/PqqE/SkfB family radical SAM enzyme
MTLKEELDIAKQEIGEEEYNKYIREVFDIPCLDYVKTIVINLPESCYADCDYCIDKKLRKHTIDNETFLKTCEIVLKEFPNCKEVSISGGSLNADDFNKLIYIVKSYFPDSVLTWNTNGVLINEEYLQGISKINYINLHRNSANDTSNRNIFRTNKDIITIEEAKRLMGDSLSIRVTVDENFDLDEYIKLGCSLNLNRLLPGTEKSNNKFNEVSEKLLLIKSDHRRRNVYLSTEYKGIPIRLSVGDVIAECVPNRRPTFLNVAVIHRSGIVCGSWFENDKRIFDPSRLEEEKFQFDSILNKSILQKKL